MQIRRNSGFTLLEVLIAVTVLSILMALAIPSFREMMDRNAVTTAANDLLSSILIARSEAIKRESPVVIAKVGDWGSRYRVFNDLNNNNKYNKSSEAPLILDHRSSNSSVTITGNGVAADHIRFNSRGRASLTTNQDFFSITKGSATRYVCFSATGRPRIQEASCS